MKIFNHYAIKILHPDFIKFKRITYPKWMPYEKVIKKIIKTIVDPFLNELVNFSYIALDKDNALKVTIYDRDDNFTRIYEVEYKSWDMVNDWLEIKL